MNENAIVRRTPGLWHGLLLLVVESALLIFVFSFAQYYWGLWGMVVTQLGLAVITLTAVLLSKSSLGAVFPVKRPRFRHLFGSLFIWLGAYFSTLGVSLALMLIFPEMSEVNQELLKYIGSDGMAMRILAIAVLPGICEEMMHRGFILSSCGVLRRNWLRVVYMGLLFGVFHLDPYRFLPTALLGMALTYIMLRTENIIYPILCHFMNNLISALATGAVDMSAMETGAAAEMLSPGQAMLMLGLGMGPLLAGFLMLRERAKPVKAAAVITVCVTAGLLLLSGMFVAVYQFAANPLVEAEVAQVVSEPVEIERSFTIPVDYANYRYRFTAEAKNHLCSARVLDSGGTEALVLGAGMELDQNGYAEFKAGEYRVIFSFEPLEGDQTAEEITAGFTVTMF